MVRGRMRANPANRCLCRRALGAPISSLAAGLVLTLETARRPSVIWNGNPAEHAHRRYTPGPTQRLAMTPLPRDSSPGVRPVRPSTATTRPRARDHPTIANVSGTAARHRDPPIGDFFPKAENDLTRSSSQRLGGTRRRRAFPLGRTRCQTSDSTLQKYKNRYHNHRA